MTDPKAESKAKQPGRKSTRSGLGRGLGALIPQTLPEAQTSPDGGVVDPLGVLFPERGSVARRVRGGSAKDLLQPKAKESKKQSAKNKAATNSSSASRAEQKTDSPSTARAMGGDTQRTADTDSAEKKIASASKKLSTQAGTKKSAQQSKKVGVTGGKAEANTEKKVAEGTKKSVEQDVTPTTEAGQQDKELFEDVLSGNVSRETIDGLVPVPGATFAEIPIDYIVPNTRQPREVFDEDDLAELAASIKEVGVLQPVVVRPINQNDEPNDRLKEYLEEKPEARFELIMGERRTRASELAGETTIPAIIRSTEDQDLLRDALLENLHRAQLNPLEEASAYQQLMADFGATQEELSKRIARSRPQIANTLRLLKLPPTVQKKVAAQVISAGHARALLSLSTPEDMERLADRIVAEGLSVRTTEELVRLGRVKVASQKRPRAAARVSELGESVIEALQDLYDTRVTISEGRTKGKIVIEFAGSDDLQRIADLITQRRSH